MARIDTRDIQDMLEVALRRLETLDGTKATDVNGARMSSAENAEITRELLYLEHLIDKARVAVMEQYHSFKGTLTRGRNLLPPTST